MRPVAAVRRLVGVGLGGCARCTTGQRRCAGRKGGGGKTMQAVSSVFVESRDVVGEPVTVSTVTVSTVTVSTVTVIAMMTVTVPGWPRRSGDSISLAPT
ncbi:hypothetical protein EV126DRAFT_123664 [Verticillium dahliae]|nr:hypothetical protein EV126DRAFT_123664 [Verticillium dahliae]